MSSKPNEECWGLIIETSEYTGNFEREMCAWCTGKVGEEDNTGEDLIDPNEDYSILDECILQVPDEYGCGRPVSLCDDNSNNLVIYFYNKPLQPEIDFIKRKTYTFNEARKTQGNMKEFYQDSNIQILGFKVIHYTINQEIITV